MMRLFLIIIAFILSNNALSQNLTLIYVDNSRTVTPSLLSEKLESIIIKNTNPGFLILGNDSLSKITEYDLYDDNLISRLRGICKRKTNTAKSQTINEIIFKYFSDENVFEGLKQSKSIDLHFFFHINTYVYQDFFKLLINKLIIDNMLEPQKTSISINLDWYEEKTTFSNYVENNKQDKNYQKFNLKINKY